MMIGFGILTRIRSSMLTMALLKKKKFGDMYSIMTKDKTRQKLKVQ
jgi:hypothetical protein